MKEQPDPEQSDSDNPEWSESDIGQAGTFATLPASLRQTLRTARGPQKHPTKVRITIRLSPDVVASFRATGEGWQGRIDGALRDWLKAHAPG